MTECAWLVLPQEKICEVITRIETIEKLPAIREIVEALQP